MPITPTYPGVYIEELPSGVRTITGVATSVAAFIDFFKRGPMHRPVQIFSLGDFEREFGGLEARSEASYGLQQFFLNGGTQAWVVRVASGAAREASAASAKIASTTSSSSAAALTVTAIHEGAWGNTLRVRVDNETPTMGEFNLTVSEYATVRGRTSVARQEVWRNLSMTGVNDMLRNSNLVRVTAHGTAPPLANGTLSGVHNSDPTIPATPQIRVSLTGGSMSTPTTLGPVDLSLSAGSHPLADVAPALQAALRTIAPAQPALANATVTVVGQRFQILAGPGDPALRLAFEETDASKALLLTSATKATANVQEYQLGGAVIADTAQLGGDAGVDGVPPDGVVAATAAMASAIPPGAAALTVTAIHEGAWGNTLRVRVDNNTPTMGEFNLTVSEYATVGGRTSVARQEVWRNLSMTEGKANSVATVVNDVLSGSNLVRMTAHGTTPPLANGTLSGMHNNAPEIPKNPQIQVILTDGSTPNPPNLGPVALPLPAGSHPLADVAPALEAALRTIAPAQPTLANATVTVVGQRFQILAGPGDPALRLVFGETDASKALLLTDGATANVQEYQLGGATIADTAQLRGVVGADGDAPNGTALIGSLAAKRGIYALEDVPLFNLLCIPRTAMLSDTEAQAVLTVAQAYCEKRRAFLLIDTPKAVASPQAIQNTLAALPRHRNAALYYPRLRIPDPLDNFRLRTVGASGTIAGICARTDSTRGVWKAPAGTEAVLRNVVELDDVLTDAENGVLNPLAVNCLRTFPIYGTVCWGARTLDGSDQQASDWKYIPVRRLALFLEESLYRGTQWVVFEPNDEPLWAQIRLNLGAFMHNLFVQGAFQGTTPRQAYFVKCDRETTTQNDINLGTVNIVVGFAPLKPAEFVIIKVQQMAGQLQV